MNAPINLYFDVNSASEIAGLVNSDTENYERFIKELTWMLYPLYDIVSAFVLVIYTTPSLALVFLFFSFLMQKQKSNFKPVDKV